MIKYIAVIRPHHISKVLAVDGHDVRRVCEQAMAEGARVIGEYVDKDGARRHMLLALQAYRPSSERKRA